MRPIESYPDKEHCELCGALKTLRGIDPEPYHSSSEIIRRLAFIADVCPSFAMLMIYCIAGRSEREIASKIHKSQAVVHKRIENSKMILDELRA